MRHDRKTVETLFVHSKLARRRLSGANRTRDASHLAAATQNLSKLARLTPLLTAA